MNRTVKKIVSHTDDTCTLFDVGVLLCWGYWTHRQRWGSELNSASSGRRINDVLNADPDLREVVIGERHGCAVSHRHDGFPSSDARLQNTPRHILPMRTFARVFMHGDPTCALTDLEDRFSSGELLCWGSDPGGMIVALEEEKERPITGPMRVWLDER